MSAIGVYCIVKEIIVYRSVSVITDAKQCWRQDTNIVFPVVLYGQIPLCRLPRNFPARVSFGEVGVMEFGL